MGLGTKLKEALNGDNRDHKEATSHANHENRQGATTQPAPGVVHLPDEEVPRSHADSINDRWYASGSSSGRSGGSDDEASKPRAQGSTRYLYGHRISQNLDDVADAEAPRRVTGLRKAQNQETSTTHDHHRQAESRDSTHAHEEKGVRSTPYWGDAPLTKKKDPERATEGAYGNRKDTFDLYDGVGGHEQLQGRPRDERRNMNSQDDSAHELRTQANGTRVPGFDPVDRIPSGAGVGLGGMAAGSSRGTSTGSRSGMGDDHYGPGHAGAKVLHQCDNCGVDNDISRYFRKEVVYRME
jgi:hypothetical protein